MRTDHDHRRHPVPERDTRPYRPAAPMDIEPEETEAAEVTAEAEAEAVPPQPTWEPIDDAPRDGRDVIVRWGEEDTEGRVVRWKHGRYFTGRRWMAGGRWVPSEGLWPLTMDPPTLWLRPVGHVDPVIEDALNEHETADA